MTSAQLDYPTVPRERRPRTRGDRPAALAPRQRHTGMVSEAVVARYIRDLSEHGRRVHGVAVPRAERPQVVAQ
jgi:hypothetical protein